MLSMVHRMDDRPASDGHVHSLIDNDYPSMDNGATGPNLTMRRCHPMESVAVCTNDRKEALVEDPSGSQVEREANPSAHRVWAS
jgi:hypothetical protein